MIHPGGDLYIYTVLFLLFVAAAAAGEPSRLAHPKPPEPAALDLSPRLLLGFNFSYGAADPAKPGATRNAPSLLGAIDVALGDSWFLCPGVGLLARGVQTSVFTWQSFDLKGDIHLDYVELPLLLKKAVATSRHLSLTFFGGPAVAQAIRRQVELLGAVSLDISDHFFGTDTLMYFGTGVEYRNPSGPGLVAELRYALGLADLDRTENQYRTRGILLLLGVRY